jgi:hypothetical protein
MLTLDVISTHELGLLELFRVFDSREPLLRSKS